MMNVELKLRFSSPERALVEDAIIDAPIRQILTKIYKKTHSRFFPATEEKNIIY